MRLNQSPRSRSGSVKWWFAATLLAAMPGGATPVAAEVVGAELVATLNGTGASTVFVTHAPGLPNDLFVVDRRGLIRVLDLTTGTFAARPYLDIQSLVDDSGGEQGLLGLAFDPDFANNGHFYVNYTRDPGPGRDRTRIDRFTDPWPPGAGSVSAGSRSPVLEFEQNRNNHNGGWIGFSPTDDLLYIATGDSGGGNDPDNVAQNRASRLGKILRVDPGGDDFPSDAVENYAVPPDNPFVGDSAALDEVWSYGLRNPWRSSFDRETGDLWIGDVGQNAREEINFQPEGRGGDNYGWRLREGDIATPGGGVGGPTPADYVGPAYDYVSNGSGLFGGNSTVGGYVYRGPDPEVQGRYFFGDSFPSQLWSFDPADPDGTVANLDSLLNPAGAIGTPVSFGEDAVGNLYIVDLDGDLYRIVTDALREGDYNADGQIDDRDYDVWATDYGSSATSSADGNGDGVVDAADYTLWRDALATQVESATVPEVSSLAASWIASLIAASFFRRTVA